MSFIRQINTQLRVANLAVCLAACSGASHNETALSGAADAPTESKTYSEFVQVLSENSDYPEAAVRAGYRAILQRDGDVNGVREHALLITKNGPLGWESVIVELLKSDEFAKNIRPSQGHRDILDRFYLGFLNRNVDVGGAAEFLSRMKTGQFEETALIIGTSHEFFNRVFSYAQMDEARFVSAAQKIYAALVERAPTPSELERIRGEWAWNGLRGLYLLVDNVANGSEFKTGAGRQRTTAELVQLFFRTLYARVPSVAEATKTSELILSGQLDRSIFRLVSSSEFFEKL